MNKLFIQHLAQNPPLLINPLASITPQTSLDPSPRSTLKRPKKGHTTEVKINVEVKVSIIESDLDIEKGKQCPRRTSKHLKMEKFKTP